MCNKVAIGHHEWLALIKDDETLQEYVKDFDPCTNIFMIDTDCPALKDAEIVAAIRDSGSRTTFETGAVRDIQEGKGRRDLLPIRALQELSKHYEVGALKYDARNWEKGIELHTYVNSAMNHLFKFLIGRKDEPHLVAAAWNIMGLIDTIIRIKEGLLPESLNTLPVKLDDINMYYRSENES